MKCPKCGSEMEFGVNVCDNCGTRLAPSEDYDASFDYSHEIVYSEKSKNKGKKEKRSRLVALVISAAAACAVIFFVLLIMRGNNGEENSSAAPVTTAATEPLTTAKPADTQTTAAAETTEAPNPQAEKKLETYLQESDIYESLAAQSDNNMGLSVYPEDQALIAVYSVSADSSDPEQIEYISTLEEYFDEVCANLDKAIYDMKQATGIENAELEIKCVDLNGVVLFDRSIS